MVRPTLPGYCHGRCGSLFCPISGTSSIPAQVRLLIPSFFLKHEVAPIVHSPLGARDIRPDKDLNGFRCDFETLNGRGFKMLLAKILTQKSPCTTQIQHDILSKQVGEPAAVPGSWMQAER